MEGDQFGSTCSGMEPLSGGGRGAGGVKGWWSLTAGEFKRTARGSPRARRCVGIGEITPVRGIPGVAPEAATAAAATTATAAEESQKLTNRTLTQSRTKSRSEEHTSELQSLRHLVCRLLLEKK